MSDTHKHDPPEPVSEAAVLALREQAALAGHRGKTPEACRLLDDEHPDVRATALRALHRTGELTARLISNAVSDRHPTVRIAALELAANHGGLAAEEAAALLDDTDHRVVEAAAWACGEIASRSPCTDSNRTDSNPQEHAPVVTDSNPQEHAPVVDALARTAASHDNALCRESAIAALGAIGDPAGLSAILAGLQDKPAVRRRAVIALAPFDGPDVEAALARAVLDRDRQTRDAATELQRHQTRP